MARFGEKKVTIRRRFLLTRLLAAFCMDMQFSFLLLFFVCHYSPDYSFSYRSIDRQPIDQEAPAHRRRRYELLHRVPAMGDSFERSEDHSGPGRDQIDRE